MRGGRMLKEFKEFIMRGNALDLAVGVIIGTAFTAIVTNLTSNVITPLISLVISLIFPGAKSVDDVTGSLSFSINGISFNYGLVISAVITFLITAFVLFAIIKTANKVEEMVPKKEEVEDEDTQSDEQDAQNMENIESILSDIKELLERQGENHSDN